MNPRAFMRDRRLIVLVLGSLAGAGGIASLGCSGKHLHVGDDGMIDGGAGRADSGSGQAGSRGGQGGAAAGAPGSGGSILPSGTAGATGGSGAGGTTGSGGGAGQAGAGGVAGGSGGAIATGAGGSATGGAMGAGGGGTAGSGGATGQAGATGSPGLSLLAGGLGGPGNADGVGAAARFASPYGVASDGAGNFYVADMTSNTIRKVVIATGAVTTLAGTAGQYGTADGTGAAARFNSPNGITGDGAGNLYVTDNGSRTIRKIVIATGAVTTLAGPGGFYSPSALVTDGAGNLFVADAVWGDIQSNVYIRKVVIATGAVTNVATWMTIGAFYGPFGIAVDGAGNLFVPDNQTIRKVVIATGAVTTFAGADGQSGSADGTGAIARFSGPNGIAGDGAGNLYVADTGNSTIRKVVIATAAVTTLAGAAGQSGNADGIGAAARFNTARSIASDGAGNLGIGDVYNTSIRKVVIATGAVTTLAGTTTQPGSVDDRGAAARFRAPGGVTVDGAGNVYVADTYNYTIRQIVRATGAVSTLVGTAGLYGNDDGIGAAARFNLPGALASDGAGNLYVVDDIIRKIVVATGAVSTVTTGPGRNSGDPAPAGLASDGAGNLYFTNAGTTIWKVVIATGALTAVAGADGQRGTLDGTGAAATFNEPLGLACDGAGNLYVADTGNYTIRKIALATRVVTTLAGTGGQGTEDGPGAAARFTNPTGLASDGAGNLYVADGTTIRKIVVATKTVSTVIGSGGRIGVLLGTLPASLSAARDVALLPTGEIAIVDSGENAILLALLK